jgi:EAL domain-containing protein (putative c-di-GMP-specific phosphodiesterase class I)/GGDEF domain-containing protein
LTALEGIILDVSDRKKIEKDLRYTNEHDRWTGLYNRVYFENLLHKGIAAQTVQNRAIVGVNLSAVYSLASAYGFDYTQDLIKQVADILSLHCNADRALFSTYESLFVFYLSMYKDKEALAAFCIDIAQALEPLLDAERIGAGIGIVEITRDHQEDVDQLLRNLLIASQEALDSFDGTIGCRYFDANMEAQIVREADIKRELALAAADPDQNALFMKYQPIFDLQTNRICGFEALARIRSEKLGLVPPLEFIPIAEKTKLILPIGKMAMRMAFLFLNTLRLNGFDTITVSVNVSVLQLLRDDFSDSLHALLRECEVPPEFVSLEITESVFASNYQDINKLLKELKDAGVQIALDDFGTGYSSLARERDLNINCLKIDKSFIDKLMDLNPDEAITGDVISMAHKLGHCVIAEGVEHAAQLQYLRRFGCDKVQGYLISAPLDEASAISLLRNSR